MQITRKKQIIIICSVLAAVLLIYFFIGSGNKTKSTYEFVEASIGPVKKTISVTGVLDVIDPNNVTSHVNSYVRKVYVDYNQHVKKGQLLAVIDSTEINQAIYKKSLELESARLQLLSSERNLEGKKKMFSENLISRQGLKQAEILHQKELFSHKKVLLDYQQLKDQLAHTKVASPINGIVLSREVEKDMPVTINKLLFVIVPSLKKMKLVINVDESDIGNIKKGQIVNFSVSAFPDRIFSGKIEQLRYNPVKRGGLVTYESVVVCDNEELLLKPGMTATATVEVASKNKTLRVLNQAFLVTPSGEEDNTARSHVWVKTGLMGGSKPFKKIPIKTGIVGDMYTEIQSGELKEGEEVLINIREKK